MISGTSMATPQVAGAIAYFIGLRGNMSPANMDTLLKTLCERDIITGIRKSFLTEKKLRLETKSKLSIGND